MRLRQLVLALPLVLALATFVPMASGHALDASRSGALAGSLPLPVSGKVVICKSTVVCTYAFNTSKGTGWANVTASYSGPALMALQLPGEKKASHNLTYTAYIAKLTGTYTYWTVGNFLGTDVNSGHVVYGTTNTNFTVTCHGHSGRGGGCTYTYTTDNGTIVVHFTVAAITSTSVACSPTFTSPGAKVSCTVTVTNGWNASRYPTGKVTVSDGNTGSLSLTNSTCSLSKGKCSFTYHPADDTCGNVVIAASFVGSPTFYKSAGAETIQIYVNGGC
ncbi:MAG TPA: hypothetical protein VGU43_07400 [Thermoplasmata archaeon]|nr:hypothetical protein [Thermoplasmata archaeon]